MGVSRFGMKSFRDIISLFGRPDDLAKIIGVSIYCARNWRARNSIHPEYWPLIIKAAGRLNPPVKITAEQLMKIAVVAEKERRKAA
jgi:hypothetical protein